MSKELADESSYALPPFCVAFPKVNDTSNAYELIKAQLIAKLATTCNLQYCNHNDVEFEFYTKNNKPLANVHVRYEKLKSLQDLLITKHPQINELICGLCCAVSKTKHSMYAIKLCMPLLRTDLVIFMSLSPNYDIWNLEIIEKTNTTNLDIAILLARINKQIENDVIRKVDIFHDLLGSICVINNLTKN